MKAWSVIVLLSTAAILATVPISPQVTPRGLQLSVDKAQAITYGRYRRVARRTYRRGYRYAAYAGAVGAGYYGAGFYGGYYGQPYSGAGYGSYYDRQPVGGGGGQFYYSGYGWPGYYGRWW